jgi:hypothetical protein
LNDNPDFDMQNMMCKASAWYVAAYKSASSGSVDGISFPWNTCYDYLNRIKCDYELRNKQTRNMPLTIADCVVSEK